VTKIVWVNFPTSIFSFKLVADCLPLSAMQPYQSTDYVQAFRKGESSGFEYFFNALYNAVYFFAFSYVKDKLIAEDIVSISFIRLWNKRTIFENEAGIRGYLYKSVYNASIRHIQQTQSRNLHNNSYANQMGTVQETYIDSIIRTETINLLHKAISHLPPQCRNVFTKLFIEGKSVAETAQEMNLTISTIKNQKARGIKLLKPKFLS
jgi:RNA polymerase sigma-70 factor (ECF subfamily)